MLLGAELNCRDRAPDRARHHHRAADGRWASAAPTSPITVGEVPDRAHSARFSCVAKGCIIGDISDGGENTRALRLTAMATCVHSRSRRWAWSFGDIGTSPLYTMREAFGHAGGLHLSEPAVLGVLSLVFWSLILVVTVKYVALILRADNRGEGGVLALGALASRAVPRTPALCWLIPALTSPAWHCSMATASITPAISVLSAVEGLKTAAPVLAPYVVPIATLVLLGLFLIQSRGTARVGVLFGPVMLAWFATLGLLGFAQIVQNPTVLAAPRSALCPGSVRACRLAGFRGARRHRARRDRGRGTLRRHGPLRPHSDPPRLAQPRPARPRPQLLWPGCLGPPRARVARAPLLPSGARMGALAPDRARHLRHIIAASGDFGRILAHRQAIKLGYLPRMTVKHTSATQIGQIYIPRVNWLVMTGVLLLVFGFRSSGNLAAAYGISVTGAMAIDAILAGLICRLALGLGRGCGTRVRRLSGDRPGLFRRQRAQDPFGGWFPLVVAAAFAYLVATWRRGRGVLWDKLYGRQPVVAGFVAQLEPGLIRVGGTAVYMTGNPEVVPTPLMSNIEHNQVLHEEAVLMTVRTQDVPYVPEDQRLEVARLGAGFFRVVVSYGFMDSPMSLEPWSAAERAACRQTRRAPRTLSAARR